MDGEDASEEAQASAAAGRSDPLLVCPVDPGFTESAGDGQPDTVMPSTITTEPIAAPATTSDPDSIEMDVLTGSGQREEQQPDDPIVHYDWGQEAERPSRPVSELRPEIGNPMSKLSI